jgi:chromosome segregation ATPase
MIKFIYIKVAFIFSCFYNKRFDAIRLEHERALESKNSLIAELREQMNQLSAQLSECIEKRQKELEKKDCELSSLKVLNESLNNELSVAQSELKQARLRLDAFKLNEKEAQATYEKDLRELETQNEKLLVKYDETNKQAAEWRLNCEASKCQLKKYEQLIDNLNEQLTSLKADHKELKIKFDELTHSTVSHREAKISIELKCQLLQNTLEEYQKKLIKYDNYEKNFNAMAAKYKQLQQTLNYKLTDVGNLEKELEACQTKIHSQNKQLDQQIESRIKIECELKQAQAKLQNDSALLQHSCKANKTLNEEKFSLEKELRETQMKVNSFKFSLEHANEKCVNLESQLENMKNQFEQVTFKFNNIINENESLKNKNQEISKVQRFMFTLYLDLIT